MPKAIIRLGYNEYAMDLQDAIAVLDIIDKAEIYKSKYQAKTDAFASFTSYHIYSQENETDMQTLTLMSGDAYRKAKLLGRPDDN